MLKHIRGGLPLGLMPDADDYPVNVLELRPDEGLLLVGVLFIGVTAWKEGANRAACVLNISSMQKAVRSYQNSNELAVGAACTMTNIAGTGLYFATAPTCPTANAVRTLAPK